MLLVLNLAWLLSASPLPSQFLSCTLTHICITPPSCTSFFVYKLAPFLFPFTNFIRFKLRVLVPILTIIMCLRALILLGVLAPLLSAVSADSVLQSPFANRPSGLPDHATAEEVDGSVIFKYMGESFPSQGYAFIRCHIDLEPYLDSIAKICSAAEKARSFTVDNAKDYHWKNHKPNVFYTIVDNAARDCIGALRDVQKLTIMANRQPPYYSRADFDQSRQERSGTASELPLAEEDVAHSRHERGVLTVLGIAIGSLIGTLSLKVIAHLLFDDPDNVVIENLGAAEKAIDEQHGAITRLYQLVNSTHEELEAWKYQDRYDANGIFIAHAVQSVVGLVSRLKGIYAGALAGHFSTELLQYHDAGSALRRLCQKVQDQGYRALIDTTLELHQVPTTFMATNNTLSILAQVPVVSNTDTLFVYRFQQFPIQMEDGLWWEIEEPKEDVLLVNADRTLFRTMTRGDLAQCRRYRQVYVCQEANVLRRVQNTETYEGPRYCLFFLFQENYAGIKRSCKISPSTGGSQMLQISHHSFMIQNDDRHQGIITCRGKTPRNIPTSHLARFSMGPGCVAMTKTHRGEVITTSMPNGEDSLIFEFDDRSALNITRWNFTALTLLHRLRGNDSKFDVLRDHSLAELNPDTPKFHPMSPSHWDWSLMAGLLTTLASIIVLCCCIRRYRARHSGIQRHYHQAATTAARAAQQSEHAAEEAKTSQHALAQDILRWKKMATKQARRFSRRFEDPEAQELAAEHIELNLATTAPEYLHETTRVAGSPSAASFPSAPLATTGFSDCFTDDHVQFVPGTGIPKSSIIKKRTPPANYQIQMATESTT